MEIQVDVGDDWDEAWEVAVDLKDADRALGFHHSVEVRPVMVSTGRRHARRCWAIYLVDPPEEPQVKGT